MKNSIIIFVIAVFFSCAENKDDIKANSLPSEDSCKIFYTDDQQSGILFKNIFSEKYENNMVRIKNDQIKISSSPIKSNSDSTRIDSIITIKTKYVFLKYYSRTNSKVLLAATVTNNDLQLVPDVIIGMSYQDFLIKNNFKQEIQKTYNCIDISTQSEYDNLHFLFKNGELVSLEYTSTVESFE